jgi:DNA-binding transcriptional ArsR family regulator
VHALDVLGDPVRRRILELLATGEQSSGQLARVVSAEFGISHPAVSQHLRVLREHGFTSVRPEGTRRLYAVEPGPLRELDAWVEQFRGFWTQRLDALGTELRRGASGRAPSAQRAGARRTPPASNPSHRTHPPRTDPPRNHPEETR